MDDFRFRLLILRSRKGVALSWFGMAGWLVYVPWFLRGEVGSHILQVLQRGVMFSKFCLGGTSHPQWGTTPQRKIWSMDDRAASTLTSELIVLKKLKDLECTRNEEEPDAKISAWIFSEFRPFLKPWTIRSKLQNIFCLCNLGYSFVRNPNTVECEKKPTAAPHHNPGSAPATLGFWKNHANAATCNSVVLMSPINYRRLMEVAAAFPIVFRIASAAALFCPWDQDLVSAMSKC